MSQYCFLFVCLFVSFLFVCLFVCLFFIWFNAKQSMHKEYVCMYVGGIWYKYRYVSGRHPHSLIPRPHLCLCMERTWK